MFTVRLDIEVDDALIEANDKWHRLDDAWNMIEWALARDPTVGRPLSESGHARTFVFDGSHAHQMPTIQVVYVFEPPYVTIKAVSFRDPGHSAGTA
jgi:hypothetical protein